MAAEVLLSDLPQDFPETGIVQLLFDTECILRHHHHHRTAITNLLSTLHERVDPISMEAYSKPLKTSRTYYHSRSAVILGLLNTDRDGDGDGRPASRPANIMPLSKTSTRLPNFPINLYPAKMQLTSSNLVLDEEALLRGDGEVGDADETDVIATRSVQRRNSSTTALSSVTAAAATSNKSSWMPTSSRITEFTSMFKNLALQND